MNTAPSKDDPSVMGNMKTQMKTVRQPIKWQNIQGEDNDTHETHGTCRPAPHPLCQQSVPKRKKKFMSYDEDNCPIRSILITWKHTSLASTTQLIKVSEMQTPGRLDEVVILPLQQQQSIPFAITPKSVTNVSNWMYLITCAIDGVGVWERLQAKSKGDEVLPPKCTQIHTPKLYPTKTQAKAATTKRKKKPACVFTYARQKDVLLDLLGDSHADQPMEGVTPHPDPLASLAMQPLETVLPPATAQLITNPIVGSGRLRHQPKPEPTARDILHSIHDLSRWFNLLATNEWVDVLDTRLGVMEETLDVRLTVLEKHLSALNQHWTATSSSLGNLAMALQKHKDDQMIHHPCESIAGDS
ncbi:hypothetical protein BDR06DRAFT_968995 [Suillus hirtellus]|nr:hypothetical protein BDR06DRAFT_968995 [Suillus hirtellus]